MIEATNLTKTIDVGEAQSHFSEILSLVAEGAEVILTEDNKPVARLVAFSASDTSRVAGLHNNAIWTSDDFDGPLPDEFWIGTE
jgi:antitoxin (DNA-binding transcriptional repressor) of toxin-antitoxin stability system